MRKRLQSLGFSFTPDFDSLAGTFAAAQEHRQKNGSSESRELTRTTALAVVLVEAPEIQGSLWSFGLESKKFLAEVGFADFSFSQASQADVDLYPSLDEAITRYVRSDDPVLQTSKEVFAILILEDAARIFSDRAGSSYQLEGVLRTCGLDLKKLSDALQSRSLPFDPRRTSPKTDDPAHPAAGAARLEATLPPNLGVTEPPATTPFYSDHPARRDLLNRKAVAETIATMIESVWREDDREQLIDRSFIVHLHGRWGSGKTSILNFLKEALFGARTGSARSSEPHNPAWTIINYNAWRNQSLGPAWWTLMEAVYIQAREQLGGWISRRGPRLVLRDRWWRIRCSYAPYALGAVALITFALWLGWIWNVQLVKPGEPWFGEGVKVIASILGLIAAAFAFGQNFLIGSARTAKSYLELSRDPLTPLTRRYSELIDDIGRPVAVFIDDLDRCNGEFVVELLQTIQTLLRKCCTWLPPIATGFARHISSNTPNSATISASPASR
jgi:hypothetical protein